MKRRDSKNIHSRPFVYIPVKISQAVILRKIFIYELNSITEFCTKNHFSGPLLMSLFYTKIKKITQEGSIRKGHNTARTEKVKNNILNPEKCYLDQV